MDSGDEIRECPDLASNISNKMNFPVKRSRGLGSQADSMDTNFIEKKTCVRCNSSGKLLICSDRGCPIAVHEKCINCVARYDDMGNFYCPYCSYRRALKESSQARQKAIQAKKALSTFLDDTTSNSNTQKQEVGTTNDENMQKTNAFDSLSGELHEDLQEVAFIPKCSSSKLPCNLADKSLGIDLNEIPTNIYSNEDKLNAHDEHRNLVEPVVVCSEETINPCETTEVSKRRQADDEGQIDENPHEGDLEDDCDDALDGAVNLPIEGKLENGEEKKEERAQKVSIPSNCEEPDVPLHEKGKTDVEASDSVSRKMQTVPKHTNDTDKDCVPVLDVGSPMRSFAKLASKLKSTLANQKITTSDMAVKLEKRPNSRSNTPDRNTRRQKLPWSKEEEEMLKEGVKKFLTTTNKNLPWRKILDFGHHIFDGTRTPVDLKDKWRNMLAKESSEG